MIKRTFLLNELEKWKSSERRKPLIIRGARQVGKTTLVTEFGKKYRHFIHLNLERAEHLQFFVDYEDVGDILDAILLSRGISEKDYGKILLFIDEIQESPKAIHLLRYFFEDFPKLHVIAAGSLLEFALKDVRSFPVGRVEYLFIQPLTFVEYLQAIDHNAAIAQFQKPKFADFAHSILLSLFHEYVIIGGMPEIVAAYVQERSVAQLTPLYESVWTSYSDDAAKYANNASRRNIIRHLLQSAPTHVDERVTFQNFGNSNYKSREVGEAFRALDAARIVQLIYPSTDVEPPSRPDFRKSPRLQFLDTGLLNHALGIQSKLLAMDDFSPAYKGRIIPHIITQEISAHQRRSFSKPQFWVREKKQSSAEIDLLITVKGKLIPVEIKSGPTEKLRSLHQFMDMNSHEFAVRMYAGKMNVEQHTTAAGKTFTLMNLPYYFASRLHEFTEMMINGKL